MKKIFVIILTLLFCFEMAACGGSGGSGPDSSAQTANSEEDTSDASVEVDKNLLSVDLTIPASFFEGQDMTTFDTEEYAKEEGFIGVKQNDDGSITITMTKARHKEIVAEMEAEAEKNYQELIDDTDFPYIENITHDKDFKTITVEVDRTGYDAAMFDMTPLAVGFQAGFYQLFAGIELHSEVIMKYKDTGEVISTTVYPDAFPSNEE